MCGTFDVTKMYVIIYHKQLAIKQQGCELTPSFNITFAGRMSCQKLWIFFPATEHIYLPKLRMIQYAFGLSVAIVNPYPSCLIWSKNCKGKFAALPSFKISNFKINVICPRCLLASHRVVWHTYHRSKTGIVNCLVQACW